MPYYTTNSLVRGVATPPIADVQAWVEGRSFPADQPLLDVSQAVPSYPPAPALSEHLSEVLRVPATSIYTDILGIPALRSALARHLSDDYRGYVQPEQVAITAGCNQAFCMAIDAMTAPGDEVVMPVPYYFNHQMWLEMRGISPRYVLHDACGEMNLDEVAASLGPRSRVILLINPGNPSGQEYSSEFIGGLYELARERKLALIIDETYKDFRSHNAAPHTLFQQERWDQVFVHLFSFSKAYALTGYRVGALVGNAELIASVEKMLDCMTICPSHIGQAAALYALQHLADWRTGKAKLMAERRVKLRDSFTSNRLRYEVVSSGAYFAYVRHPFEDQSATTVARRLADDHNILCLPGSMFGAGQERYLRFAFANLDASEFPELVARLVRSQDN